MEEAIKNDIKDGKLRWDLLPLELVEEIVKVFTFGSQKYAPNTWMNLENGERRYHAALLRHLCAFEKGETHDPESGLNHLSHVAWNALAILHFSLQKETHHDSNRNK